MRRKTTKQKRLIIATLVVIFAVSIFLCANTKTGIFAINDKEKSELDIRFYGPDECGDGGKNGKSTRLAGNNVKEKVWNYFIDKGLNDAQTAGIMGNLWVESHFNPVGRGENPQYIGISQVNVSPGYSPEFLQSFIDAGYEKYTVFGSPYGNVYGWEEKGLIPEEDLDGLLQIALDFVWGTMEEHVISYINYNGTLTEWIKTANDPDTATEIFMAAHERAICKSLNSGCNAPAKLAWDQWYHGEGTVGYQGLDTRKQYANEFFDELSGNGVSTSYGGGTASPQDYGSNVTIVGDSITNQSTAKILEKLPKADIHSQGSKHMFMQVSGNDSGKTILDDLNSKDQIREVLVIALGTNDPGAIRKDALKSMLESFSRPSKIILVNNASLGSNATGYQQNNAVFDEVASEMDKVVVADWASLVANDNSLITTSDTMDVHPSIPQGQEAFAKLIFDSIGAFNGSATGRDDCNCGGGSGSITGGLDEEQAQKLADDYNNGDISRWGTGDKVYDILENCVSFSKYIIRFMTDLEWGSGNGDEVVDNLKAKNPDLETGSEVKPYSIFSSPTGHTGFIVAVNGDDVMSVEAAWESYKGKIVHYSKSAIESEGYKFAYIESHIDTSKFASATGARTVTTTTNNNEKIIVDAEWQDGWITSGIEGYVKEALSDHPEVTPADNSFELDYTTIMPKTGWAGPNKITLHSTEGTGAGLKAYRQDQAALSHFTIDLKNKKTYQHLPITKPASGVKTHDQSAGVQIEIVGFSSKSSSGYSDDWYLENNSAFGPTEWAYLAKLLQAISKETGIELKSDLDWQNPKRLDKDAFEIYSGIVGHMHVPGNDHTDPGNIWANLAKEIANVSDGSTTGDCGGSSWSGDFPFMFQCDYGDASFAGGTICNAGCGLTSTAMVISALTGEKVTPIDLAKKFDCDSTSNMSCVAQWVQLYGLQVEVKSLPASSSNDDFKNTINNYLKNGYMVVTSGKNSAGFSNSTRSPFTSAGHYVVFYGIDTSGYWLIADPAGHNRDWAAKCDESGKCTANDNAMDPDKTIDNGLRRTDDSDTIIRAIKK